MTNTGFDFDTLFPGFTEAEVIEWVETIGLIGSATAGDTVFDADLANLYGFVDYAKNTYFSFFSIPPDQTLGTSASRGPVLPRAQSWAQAMLPNPVPFPNPEHSPP